MGLFSALIRGAVAGAAGTTALNAATYLDMAARARPSSSTPQQAVDTIAQKVNRPVPGEGEERENRLTGLGSLSGIATGVGIGVVGGLFGPVFRHLPAGVASMLLGGAAMAATDLPMMQLGITDPKTWSSSDWLSDAVPHLAYGATTVAALRLMAPRKTATG